MVKYVTIAVKSVFYVKVLLIYNERSEYAKIVILDFLDSVVLYVINKVLNLHIIVTIVAC